MKVILILNDISAEVRNSYGVVENKITFATAYFCHDFLPSQIIFEELLYV